MKNIYTLSLLILIPLTGLFAQVEGTWKIAPEAAALAVGPTQGDFSWWSNTAGDVTTRDCFFDDTFVFDGNGTFMNVQGGSTWLEVWQGIAADGCDTPVAPHDGSNAATWAYDAMASTITLTGVGAHLGLPKVINGAEISDPANAAASIVYPVVLNNDTMTIDIDFGGGFWHFVMVKEAATSIEEPVADQFSFYPNPANTEIHITSTERIESFIVRDLTGKTLIERKQLMLEETIDISTLADGMYVLESRVGNQRSIKKMIVH